MRVLLNSLLLSSFLLFWCFSQSESYKLLHSSDEGERVSYLSRFKDHKNTIIEWSWTFDKQRAEILGDKLGFDKSILAGRPSSEVRIVAKSAAELERKKKEFLRQEENEDKKRSASEKKLITEGLFKRTSLARKKNQELALIDLDFQSAISYYKPFVFPIKRLIEDTFKTLYKEDAEPSDRIKLIMGFIEDIPYAIPPNYSGNKFIGGILSPPLIFENGYGDCDSKALLFASILANYPDLYNIIIIYQKDHLLLGLQKNNPAKNENYVSFQGKKYIYIDAVGPGRLPLGVMAYPEKEIVGIEPINFKAMPAIKASDDTIDFSTKQLGYAYDISLSDGKSALNDLHIDISTSNLEGYYTKLINMPYSDGKIYFGSESKTLFLHYQNDGYLLLRQFTNENAIPNFPIRINFDKGLKLLDQKPNMEFTLIKYKEESEQVTSYQMTLIKTDANGNFKAFVEPGRYSIIPGHIVRINNTEKIYDYDGKQPTIITDFQKE